MNIVFQDQPLINVMKEVLKVDKDAYFYIKIQGADVSEIPEIGVYEHAYAKNKDGELTIKRACDEFQTQKGTKIDDYLKDRLGKFPYVTIALRFTEEYRDWSYEFQVDKDLNVKSVSEIYDGDTKFHWGKHA